MKYTVTGQVCQIGAGQKLNLSAEQLDARRPFLTIHDEKKGKVTSASILYFKKGEEIDLPEKHEDMPRALHDALTPSSKIPAAEKPKKATKGNQGDDEGDDLDALEGRLDDADKAYAAALGKHSLPADRDLTADERKLVATEADERESAKAAFDAAVGD